MDEKRFSEILDGIRNIRVAVLGDIFLDRIYYVDRKCDEISVETGLPAYQVIRKKSVPGAAGVITNIYSNLEAGKVYGLGILSEDGDGYELEQGLKANGVDTSSMLRTSEYFTPTYSKTFFEDSETGQMTETNRTDIKNRKHLSDEAQDQIIATIRDLEDKVDAFVCQEQLEDNNRGIFTDRVIKELARVGATGKKIFVDTRWHVKNFENVIMKCNELEAMKAAGIERPAETDPHDLDVVDEALRELVGNQNRPFFVSCGTAGMKVWDNGEVRTIPAYPVKGEVDTCGAGDSALAGLSAAVCAGATLEEAAVFGNLVASLIVQQIGVTGSITREGLKQRFLDYEKEVMNK